MQEAAFRASMAAQLSDDSVDSYVAYLRRVESVLGIDLEGADLTTAGIDDLAARLSAAGVVAKSVANCRSALRAYAAVA